MKIQNLILLAGLTLSSTMAYAQPGGDPTSPPTGVPTRTMKTLDEVEARIPLVDGAKGVTVYSNGGFRISEPGSYYLTENLSVESGVAISIEVSYVTVDLNGYRVSSTGDSASGSAFWIGYYLTDYGLTSLNAGVKIHNGYITSNYSYTDGSVVGTGFNYFMEVFSLSLVEISDLTIIGNALSFSNRDSDAEVNVFAENITVNHSGGTGLRAARATNSTVLFANIVGINAGKIHNSSGNAKTWAGLLGNAISDSIGTSTEGWGISGGVITNSRGTSTSATGISGILVNGCIGESDEDNGIYATRLVKNSYGKTDSTTEAGISVLNSGPIIDSVSVDGN